MLRFWRLHIKLRALSSLNNDEVRASRDSRSLVRSKQLSTSTDQKCGAWTSFLESRCQRRFQEEVADNSGRKLLLDKIEDVLRLNAGSSRQVANVARRLV